MSNADLSVNLLVALAEVNERFIDLYFGFQAHPAIGTANQNFEIRRLNNGCLIDIYLEGETKEGPAFCWWLAVRIGRAGWSLEGSLRKTENGEQHTLREIAESSGSLIEELVISLEDVGTAVIESARAFEFR